MKTSQLHECLKFLEELPEEISKNLAIYSNSYNLLKYLLDVCLNLLKCSTLILNIDVDVNHLELNYWKILEKLVELSNEYVLIKYGNILMMLLSNDFSSLSETECEILTRDLLTFIEKVRVIVLEMYRKGKSWIDIVREFYETNQF